MRIIIKKVQRTETDDVYKAFRKSLKEDFNYYPKKRIKQFQEIWSPKFFRKRRPLVFIAKDNLKVVGFIIAKRPWLDCGVGEVNWLWVDSKYRGQSLGEKLILALEKFYLTLGVHKITLEADNPKTQNYYKKIGFAKEGFKKNDYFHMNFISYAKFLKDQK